MSDTIFLDGAVLLTAKFHGCGGSAKIPDGKIMVDGELVDAQGVTSKSIQWFPVKALSFKDTLNKRVTRHLENIGITTPFGVFISQNRVEETRTFIDLCVLQFHSEVERCLDNYEDVIARQKVEAIEKAGNPRIGLIIEAVKLSKDKFRESFKAITTPPVHVSVGSQDDADKMRTMLADKAIATLLEEASALFKKSYFGKDSTTKAATNATFELQEKFYDLAFANIGLLDVAEQFAEMLEGVNRLVEQDGVIFNAMYRFVKELSDEKSLLALIEGDAFGGSDEDSSEEESDEAEDTTSESPMAVAQDEEEDTEEETETEAKAEDETSTEEVVVSEAKAEDAPAKPQPKLVMPTPSKTEEAKPAKTSTPTKAVSPKKLNGFGNF